MLLKSTFLTGAALCLFSGAADAQSTQQCPTGATNCTISVQDAGHNETSASAANTNTTSSIAGTSSASNQSGNSISPSFDNSAQTTQNATTTTGAVDSSSNGNTSSNANQSSASNGQSNTGTSTNTLGGSSSGGNTLATGASTSSTGSSTSSTGASTSSTGASNAYLGGNTQANGSASTVGATTSSSGNNSLANDASNSGGNSATTVDASDHSSYKSKAIFIPPVVPGTPPSQLAVGNIIKETSACGPLQHVVRQPVNGTFIGLLRRAAVPQGWSDDLEPYRDAQGVQVDYRREPLANGDVRLFGHQVIMFTTVIGVASNRNIALGGGGGGGSWGQGGMGSSSSNQRMVTTIQLRDCEIGTMHTVVVEVAPKAIRG